MENATKRIINRVDSWTPEQDRRLAEIVLRNMREGRTQSEGFAEAAEALGRTPGACGFRWNGIVRKQYRDQVLEIQRTERERAAEARRSALRRRAAWRLDMTIRSLREHEEACERLERRVASLGEAVSAAVARIRQEIQALEAERRRFEERGAAEAEDERDCSPTAWKG